MLIGTSMIMSTSQMRTLIVPSVVDGESLNMKALPFINYRTVIDELKHLIPLSRS